jgi:hypothetical protein
MPQMSTQDRGSNIQPGWDIVPNLVANTGTFAGGPCRALRCTATGTFIGLTLAGVSRTITFYSQGELLVVSFKSRTGGTADVELVY